MDADPRLTCGESALKGASDPPGGGVFGDWQAGTHTGFGVANEPGSVTWNEFMGRDYDGAKQFYASVFGY